MVNSDVLRKIFGCALNLTRKLAFQAQPFIAYFWDRWVKSLRSEIAAITLFSITLVSTLILWFSVNVYEELYQEFVAEELESLSENLANDLLPFIGEQSDTFSIARTMLRMDQYEHIEYAKVFNNQGDLLSAYHSPQIMQSDTLYRHRELTNELLLTLPLGLDIAPDCIIVVKRIGDPQYSQGRLIISYDLSQALSSSQAKLISSVLPFAGLLVLVAVILVLELQRRSLSPLHQLIHKMRRIEDTKDYDVAVEETGKKEIAELTRGFNSMMSDINRQVEANRQKNALLLRQQEQMEQLANFDSLTGLPNRQFLMTSLSIELARAKRDNRELALMFLDLDGFKLVNDSFGHDVGDKLLCRAADIASECLRKGDILGRLGGDEFIIMLSNNPLITQLKDVAQRLIDNLSMPHHVDEWKIYTGVSIGISLATECDYQASDMVTNADIAMYRSKRNGRGQFTLFTQEMQDDNRRMVRIATNIAYAVESDELSLHYQPKVDCHGVVQGFEALIRWYSKELGFVPPNEFIPIAEQSDKISMITRWVITQVCRDLPALLAAYGDAIRVSLNLSAHDLKNPKVTEFIVDKMRSLPIAPSTVEFEITESAYLESFHAGNVFFETLRGFGCKIALDDFGTGYSSLSYLTEFNIDTLKIDRQFTSQIGASKRSGLITNTIIEMARHLKLTVCAEGVETHEQAHFLIHHKCDLLQGYLYGRPEPLSTVIANATKGDLPRLNIVPS